jgi:hypothetical protein
LLAYRCWQKKFRCAAGETERAPFPGEFVVFWKKEKLFDPFKSATVHANEAGTSKRATTMLPVAQSGSHEIAQTNSVKFHHLLVTLEGNQRTGCLKIINPKKKSRSAILIYKGRVVGCLYGRKNLEFQYLHQDAHQYALNDLASPGNVLDAYQLPEQLVLSAASLFHGEIVDVPLRRTGEEMFQVAISTIIEMGMPGCVVVNTPSDEMICMTYIYDHRIVGVFSAQDGWVQPTYQNALYYLTTSQYVKVTASALQMNESSVEGLGFSLTGLADNKHRALMLRPQMAAVDSFTIGSQTYSQNAQHFQSAPSTQSLRAKQAALHSSSRPSIFAITP